MAAENSTPGVNKDHYSLAYYYLGALHEEEGNYRVAIRWFEKALGTGNEHAYSKLESLRRKLILIAVLDGLVNTDKTHAEAQLIWESISYKNAYDNQSVAAELVQIKNCEKEEQVIHSALDAMRSENPDLTFQSLRNRHKQKNEREVLWFINTYPVSLSKNIRRTTIKNSKNRITP